jgi:hypothetical protein
LRFGATTTARAGGFAQPRGLSAAESPDRSLSTRSRAQDGEAPHPMRLVARARVGPSAQDRQATYDAARAICIVALLEAAEAATARTATGAAVVGFVARASAERLAVLLESTAARDAHPIVSSLARTGVIEPKVAQHAHLLIDLRPAPG